MKKQVLDSQRSSGSILRKRALSPGLSSKLSKVASSSVLRSSRVTRKRPKVRQTPQPTPPLKKPPAPSATLQIEGDRSKSRELLTQNSTRVVARTVSPDQQIISLEGDPPPLRVSPADQIPMPSDNPNVRFFMSSIKPRRVSPSLLRQKRNKVFNAVRLINRLGRPGYAHTPLQGFLSNLAKPPRGLTRTTGSEQRFGISFLHNKIKEYPRDHSDPRLT